MKVLVTGAAGFIGSHVVDRFRRLGNEVIGLDSLDPGVHHGPPEYLRTDVDYCFADLRWWQPDERFQDVEVIVHLAALGGVSRAAREPGNVISANCSGTARLLEAARNWKKLRRIIHASSFSIYGSNYRYRCGPCGAQCNAHRDTAAMERGQFEVLCPTCGGEAQIEPLTEEAVPAPLEIYGASKYMQELCYRGFEHAPVTTFRFSSVYGRRLRLDDGEATIIARLAGWIRAGQRPKLYEDGRQIRDWVYVDDLVDAMVAVISGQPAPAIVNVCSGIPVRLEEACTIIAAAVGKDCKPEVVGGYRAGDMRHCLGDAGNFRKLIRREPISLQQGASLAFADQSAAPAANS